MRPSSLLKHPIAFHRCFATITGSVDAGLFLSQAFYWSDKTDSGEFYKTREEWTEETGLSRYEQEQARKRLKEIGLLSEREERLEHRIWFRLDIDALDAALEALPEDKKSPPLKRVARRPGGEKLTAGNASKSPPSNGTETTTETTTPAVPAAGERAVVDKSQVVTSEHTQFIADWMAYYERRTGHKYPFKGIDAKATKTLLTHFNGLEPAKAFIKACHARRKEGFPFGATDTLPDLANGIARLQAALSTPPKQNGHSREPVRGVPIAANEMPPIE